MLLADKPLSRNLVNIAAEVGKMLFFFLCLPIPVSALLCIPFALHAVTLPTILPPPQPAKIAASKQPKEKNTKGRTACNSDGENEQENASPVKPTDKLGNYEKRFMDSVDEVMSIDSVLQQTAAVAGGPSKPRVLRSKNRQFVAL